MMRRTLNTAAAVALVLAGGASAQTAGDAVAGRALAEQNCARCHNIDPGGAMQLNPPSFAAIAVFRSPDQITERIWFPPIHSRMPPWYQIFEKQDVDNLTAYIVSLAPAN